MFQDGFHNRPILFSTPFLTDFELFGNPLLRLVQDLSQSNLAVQQPEQEPRHPQIQPEEVQPIKSASGATALKLGEQRKRSLEQQAEVERIGQIEPYVGLQRDENLFTALNHWRETGICGRIATMDRLGLAKSLMFYTQSQIKRRGGLLVTPASVAYIESRSNKMAVREIYFC